MENTRVFSLLIIWFNLSDTMVQLLARSRDVAGWPFIIHVSLIQGLDATNKSGRHLEAVPRPRRKKKKGSARMRFMKSSSPKLGFTLCSAGHATSHHTDGR